MIDGQGGEVMESARFRINRIFKLSRRPGFFACGDVVEGTVAVGMYILWPLPGKGLMAYAPIATIDYLDIDRAARRTEVALGIRFEEDTQEMEKLFEDLFEVGMVVDIGGAWMYGR